MIAAHSLRTFLRRRAPLALVATGLLAGSALADEQTYYFGAGPKHTNISFVSKTAVEEIVGSTHTIAGTVVVDWDAGTARVQLAVPVASLRTGIAMRDEHLRGKDWMNAKKWPAIRFASQTARKGAKRAWTLTGRFAMHGVDRPLTLSARVSRIPKAIAEKAQLGAGEWIRVHCTYAVTITDHGIVIPGGVAPKMDKTWTVTMSLSATTTKPPAAAKAAGSGAKAKTIKARRVSVDGPGTRFRFGVLAQNTNIAIESKTELETVIIASNVLSGEAAIEFQKGRGRVKLLVPVAALRTGIDMRDEHLRSPQWLDAKKFPEIVFEADKVTKAGDKTWRVEGTFTLRGVTKPLVTEVKVAGVPRHVMAKTGFPGRTGLHFRASFTLKLSDFGITIPKMAAAKVSDTLTVTFSALGLEQ